MLVYLPEIMQSSLYPGSWKIAVMQILRLPVYIRITSLESCKKFKQGNGANKAESFIAFYTIMIVERSPHHHHYNEQIVHIISNITSPLPNVGHW